MKITDLLTENTIKMELEGKNKKEVIMELVKVLDTNDKLDDHDQFLKDVLEREKKFSTAIGHGVAIPHAKSVGVKKAALVFGRSEKGVDFGSSDGELSHIFFLIAVPEKSNNEHLKILSKLSRSLMHEELRSELREANQPSEILEILDN